MTKSLSLSLLLLLAACASRPQRERYELRCTDGFQVVVEVRDGRDAVMLGQRYIEGRGLTCEVKRAP